MCALVGYMCARDRFSLELRRYTKYFLDRQDASMMDTSSSDVLSMSLSIIDAGNLLIAYRQQQQSVVRDRIVDDLWTVGEIVISTIARISSGKNNNIEVESRLARCQLKLDRLGQPWPHVLGAKLERILTEWRSIPTRTDPTMSMEFFYTNHVLGNEAISGVKIREQFGAGEEQLDKLAYLRRAREDEMTSIVGGYEFERDEHSASVLELFFRIGFDRTESWQGLAAEVNVDVPLIAEFYEEIRLKELLDTHQCQSYLMTNESLVFVYLLLFS